MENQANQPSSSDYTKFDQKTKDTIKFSVIWSAVVAGIVAISGMITSYFMSRGAYDNLFGQYLPGYLNEYNAFDIGRLINGIVWGAIGGVISGYIIAKFYPIFVEWQRKFTGNKLNTFFKLLFWPYVVVFAISLILGGTLMFISRVFIWVIIDGAVNFAAIYLYAKMMDKTVGKYYR